MKKEKKKKKPSDADLAETLFDVYNISREVLKARGNSGRNWLMSEESDIQKHKAEQ